MRESDQSSATAFVFSAKKGAVTYTSLAEFRAKTSFSNSSSLILPKVHVSNRFKHGFTY